MRFIREFIVLILCAISIRCLSQETRIKIAVVDTGIELNSITKPWICREGSADFTGQGPEDVHGHGTNIAGLIVKGLDKSKYCILILKYFHEYPKTLEEMQKSDEGLRRMWKYLETLDVQYVNMSLSGKWFYQEEHTSIKKLIERGVHVVVSAGNEGLDLDIGCVIFPACYKFTTNYYVVGSIDSIFSNKGKVVKYYELGKNQRGSFGVPMSGTSQAAANFTNRLIKTLTK